MKPKQSSTVLKKTEIGLPLFFPFGVPLSTLP